MAAKQTRRSVSISNGTYLRLKAYCEVHNCSMSGVVEKLVKGTCPDIDPIASEYLEKGTANGKEDFVEAVNAAPEIIEVEDRISKIRNIVENPEPKEVAPGSIFTF
jgi:hypothetical protein